MSFEFKKGDYVVLLKSCAGNNDWFHSMPQNYVYRLAKNCNKFNFFPEIDMKGSKRNGWSLDNPNDDGKWVKTEVRLATYNEIETYKLFKEPYPIDKTKKFNDTDEDMSYLALMLDKLN